MRFSILIAAAAFACAAPCAQPNTDQVGAALERAMAAHPTPAMTAIIIRDGRASPEVVRGIRRIGNPEPVQVGERWMLGSVTKSMTATLIARLVDMGRLSWTNRLDEMLPDLAAEMRPEYRGVTLLDLLSHSAGLPDRLSDDAYVMARHEDLRPMPLQRLEYIRKGLADPPIAPPRTRNSYSNTGFIIAGVVAERATGRSYEELMNELVFSPLGMSSATFDRPGPGEMVGHVDGRVADHPRDGNPAVFSSAGEVRMTMEDWAKFALDQLQGYRGKGRLLRPESYRRLQTEHVGGHERVWGLGWRVVPAALGRQGPALALSGSDGLWIAQMVLYPKSGNGLLVATNAAYSMGAQHSLNAAMRALAVDLAPPAPAPPPALQTNP